MRLRVARLVATIMIFLFIMTSIIFSIPLKEVQTQTIETYLDTEMRKETYIVKEPYVEKELRKKSVPIFDGERVVVPGGVDIPFSIDKPNALLVGEFDCPIAGGFYVYSVTGRIVYEMLGAKGSFEVSLLPGSYKARFRENVMWGEKVYMRLAMEWTETEDVTRYKETIAHRDTPVQIEKQRIVITKEKKSIWQLIFHD